MMKRPLYRWLNRYMCVVITGFLMTLLLSVVIMLGVSVDISKSDAQLQYMQYLQVSQPKNVYTTPGSSRSTFLAGTPRTEPGYIAIGIPTLKRLKGEYFFGTLTSLFWQSTPEQHRNMTLVAMLADGDPAFNEELLESIKVKYPHELSKGQLLVVSAPDTSFIFHDRHLKRTFNDSLERVQWRSKQNLDYAALMEISANLATYYLQVEDDVTAAPNYIQHIQDFVNLNRNHQWAGLEVCPHGFIGKLFHSEDLPKLVAILRTFYLEMPCDFLIDHFYKLMLQPKAIRRKGNLFFHQGRYSSLVNVTRKIDKIPRPFEQPRLVKKYNTHQNPEADMYHTLIVYKNYFLENAYNLRSQHFFWAKDAKDGDQITIVFKNPQKVVKIIVETGFRDKNNENFHDFIYNATLEIGEQVYHAQKKDSKPLCTTTHDMGEFKDGRYERLMNFNSDIWCFTIVITQAQTKWIVIREIVVFTEKFYIMKDMGRP